MASPVFHIHLNIHSFHTLKIPTLCYSNEQGRQPALQSGAGGGQKNKFHFGSIRIKGYIGQYGFK